MGVCPNNHRGNPNTLAGIWFPLDHHLDACVRDRFICSSKSVLVNLEVLNVYWTTGCAGTPCKSLLSSLASQLKWNILVISPETTRSGKTLETPTSNLRCQQKELKPRKQWVPEAIGEIMKAAPLSLHVVISGTCPQPIQLQPCPFLITKHFLFLISFIVWTIQLLQNWLGILSQCPHFVD